MSILNPRRVLTRAGRQAILASMVGEATDGPFFEAKLFAVTEATLAADELTLESATAALYGIGAEKAMEAWGAPMLSGTGKVYAATSLFVFDATTPAAPQDVIGVIISTTDVDTGVLAFLEFDDPVTLDEDNESLQLALEIGFDGQTFYIVPRILPLGE